MWLLRWSECHPPHASADPNVFHQIHSNPPYPLNSTKSTKSTQIYRLLSQNPPKVWSRDHDCHGSRATTGPNVYHKILKQQGEPFPLLDHHHYQDYYNQQSRLPTIKSAITITNFIEAVLLKLLEPAERMTLRLVWVELILLCRMGNGKLGFWLFTWSVVKSSKQYNDHLLVFLQVLLWEMGTALAWECKWWPMMNDDDQSESQRSRMMDKQWWLASREEGFP